MFHACRVPAGPGVRIGPLFPPPPDQILQHLLLVKSQGVYIGTDSGATTSKTCGVWANGTAISQKLRQSSTNSQLGTQAVISGWV